MQSWDEPQISPLIFATPYSSLPSSTTEDTLPGVPPLPLEVPSVWEPVGVHFWNGSAMVPQSPPTWSGGRVGQPRPCFPQNPSLTMPAALTKLLRTAGCHSLPVGDHMASWPGTHFLLTASSRGELGCLPQCLGPSPRPCRLPWKIPASRWVTGTNFPEVGVEGLSSLCPLSPDLPSQPPASLVPCPYSMPSQKWKQVAAGTEDSWPQI